MDKFKLVYTIHNKFGHYLTPKAHTFHEDFKKARVFSSYKVAMQQLSSNKKQYHWNNDSNTATHVIEYSITYYKEHLPKEKKK